MDARAVDIAASFRQRRTGKATPRGIDWVRTLRNKGPAPLAPEHLAQRHRPAAGGLLHVLLLDCSGSMLRGRHLARAKGLLAEWTGQLYRQRADLAVIGFAGRGARVVQPPRKAVAFSERWIAPIRGGGRTPIEAALAQAEQLLAQARRTQPDRAIGLWLMSDCRFESLPTRPSADVCTVVDFESGPVRLGRARRLAAAWKADYLRPELT